MSVYHYPNVRSYWSKYGFTHIMETMTLNHFEKIRSVIHFNDNENHKPVGHPQHDRLHKIRPIIEHLNTQFINAAPLGKRLSLDEQICASKIGYFMKQYLPNKPHKSVFNLFYSALYLVMHIILIITLETMIACYSMNQI